MLGAAEADALGPELARPPGILGEVGVGAHAECADLVGPTQQLNQVFLLLVLDLEGVDRSPEDLAGSTVNGDDIPLLDDTASGLDCELISLDIHPDVLAASDAGKVVAPRYDRRVGGSATVLSQHTF